MLRLFQLYLAVLFPSWRFFQEIGPGTRVEYRVNGGDWVEATARPVRLSLRAMLLRLFWNAGWNETLYLVSCAERLMIEPTTHSNQELNRRLARRAGGRGRLEFRLIFVSADGRSIGHQSAPNEY